MVFKTRNYESFIKKKKKNINDDNKFLFFIDDKTDRF